MNKYISVITLTHNRLNCTRKCLPSLLDTDYGHWELVVVDNGSADGTRDWLVEFKSAARERGRDVVLVFNDANIGCSTARNQGAGRARGDRLMFVDNDIALRSRSWLENLGNILDSSDDIGVVGPKLVYPYKPYDIQFAGGVVSKTGRVGFLGRGARRDDPGHNRRREVQCFISACMMLKRKAFEAAGGFDEAFNPVEYEDIDLSYKVRGLGYRIIYVPFVEMYHFESMTTQGTVSLPNTYLIVKHGLLFKKRWRHMFENEDGPPDDETVWKRMPPVDPDTVTDLPQSA